MPRHAHTDDATPARAKLFTNGRSQAVRLPKQFRFHGQEVSVRKQGEAVVLEPIAKRQWPTGYWQRVDRLAKALEVGRIVPIGGRLLDISVDDA